MKRRPEGGRDPTLTGDRREPERVQSETYSFQREDRCACCQLEVGCEGPHLDSHVCLDKALDGLSGSSPLDA